MKNVFTFLLVMITCSLSAQVGLQVVNDGIIEKTLTVGQTTVGDSTVHIAGGLSLSGGLAIGDVKNNLFIGNESGTSNTTGANNVAYGFRTMRKNTAGSNNTAIGYSVLFENLGGSSNTAIGAFSLTSNTSGSNNAAVGFGALQSNTLGESNIAIGYNAMKLNTEGGSNTAVGFESLTSNLTQGLNTAIGFQTLRANVLGANNTAVGASALAVNDDGSSNTAVGQNAMNANEDGSANTAVGLSALKFNTTGNDNTSMGAQSMSMNDTGQQNTAVGTSALKENTNGNGNVSVGAAALNNNNGNLNTAVGRNAFSSAAAVTTYENSTAIGANTEIDDSNIVRVGDEQIQSIGGYQPWTDLSEPIIPLKVKSNIPGLAFINRLNPVSYQTKIKSGKKIERNGFLAKEVISAASEVNFNFNGVDVPTNGNEPQGIRYATFVVPLVQAVQELSTEKEQLQKENEAQQTTIEALEARMERIEALLSQLASNVTEERTSDKQIITLSDVQLAQNNPNPFSDFTTIPYFLPAFVKEANLQITNANSQVIKVIPITNRGKGEVVLETKLLGNGAYFYTLMIDGVAQATKQMLLQK